MALDLQHYRKKEAAQASLETKTNFWSILNKDISFSGKKLSDKLKESFYLELSILLTAGVDIKAALELLGGQQRKQKYKVLFNSIKEQIISGSSLSEATKYSGYFTAYEYYSLRIGEETGKLAQVLSDLANYFNRKIKQRRQLIQALSYPVIVLVTSFGAVAFMISFIVPMFSDVFKRFGGELPYITKVIISLSAFLRQYSWLLLFVVFSSILSIRFVKNRDWFQHYSSWFLLKLPIMGTIIRKVYLSRLSSSFGLLISSKVPLLQAIQLVEQMIQFYPISQSLKQIEEDALHGVSLYKSMEKHSIYDARMLALIKVGEEVNKLDFFFYNLASQYNEEVEYQSSVMSSALEPFIIIFLGAVVGIILLAMYLPLFQLSTSIG